MGNTQTREQRTAGGHAAPPPPPPPLHQSSSPFAQHNLYTAADGTVYQARAVRPSHGNLFGRSAFREEPQDEAALAQRRQNKAEREVRKKEEKEIARRREREKSMREESVDGGFLVSSGLYISDEDYSKTVVRQLMIDRSLAPFFIGLEDHREEWTDAQLIAEVHGSSNIPAANPTSGKASHWPPADGPQTEPFGSASPTLPDLQHTNSASPTLSTSPSIPSSSLLRGRTKAPPSLTMAHSQDGHDLLRAESHLPLQPMVNGVRMEIFLYKAPIECEICYRSFPPYSNRSRCCDKPICSECFVSIKRKDPHPLERDDDDNPSAAAAARSHVPESSNLESEFDLSEIDLVSEPAKCPFCKESNFGITYQPPPFRSGLAITNARTTLAGSAGSLPSPGLSASPGTTGSPGNRPRAASIPHNASGVVTTDKIRPDWARKLLQDKLNLAKRARAATALHQQAFLPTSSRSRLGLFRRGASDPSAGDSEAAEAEGTPLDINRLIAAATDRRMGENGLVPPRGSMRAWQIAQEAEYDEILQRALRESVEDEQRRAAKAEKERQEEQKRQMKEEQQRAKEEARRQKQADKSAKASGSAFSLHRAMRSTSSIVSNSRRSSISLDSGKGKKPAHDIVATSSPEGVSSSADTRPAPSSSRGSGDDVNASVRAQTVEAPKPKSGESEHGAHHNSSHSRSASQTNFGSLSAIFEKPGAADPPPSTESGSPGFSNFGQDMLSSMNDIITSGKSSHQSAGAT